MVLAAVLAALSLAALLWELFRAVWAAGDDAVPFLEPEPPQEWVRGLYDDLR